MGVCYLQWKHSRSFAESVLAENLIPADLVEAKSMAKRVFQSHKKLQWWFEEVNTVRNALWNFAYEESKQPIFGCSLCFYCILNTVNFIGPVENATVDNLVYITLRMRNLRRKMQRINESISERRHCLRIWTTLFAIECYANEVFMNNLQMYLLCINCKAFWLFNSSLLWHQ